MEVSHASKNVPQSDLWQGRDWSIPLEENIKDACRVILEHFPLMPFWPQFVKRSYLEDMSAQYCEGLPLLKINEQERTLGISPEMRTESELTDFYEIFFGPGSLSLLY